MDDVFERIKKEVVVAYYMYYSGIRMDAWGNHEHAVTRASVPAKVRTQYFQNTNRDPYIYTDLFGGKLTKKLHGAKTILRNQQFFRNSSNFQDLIEHERSFPCSQKPATVLYPEPDESDPRLQILFLEIYF